MTASRRRFLASTAALAALPLGRVARGDAPPVRLKLHHALSSMSCAHSNFLVPWARNIEDQSGGRIRIDIFPSMALGGQPADLFDQAHYGAADIVWAMPSKTPGRFPRIELFELPFVPSRRALVASKAIEDFSARFLRDEFHEVHPICFSCADRGILHANHAIEAVAAMQGRRLDVRTRFAAQAVQALGGRAIPVPSGQLPFAVARRVVDGCIIPWHMVPALKLDELFKDHTDFADYSLSTTTYVLAMNKTAYAKLPGDLKKIIDDNSGQTAASMAGAMWDLKAKAVADAARARGASVVTLSAGALADWRKATGPVIAAWMKEVSARRVDGEKLLTSARALLAKYADEPEPQPPQPAQAPQPAQPSLPQPPPAAAAKRAVPAAPASPPATLDIPL